MRAGVSQFILKEDDLMAARQTKTADSGNRKATAAKEQAAGWYKEKFVIPKTDSG